MSLLVSRPADSAVVALPAVPAAGVSSWYPEALLYRVCVQAFQDADHDGVGDFEGLVDRLGYLQSLGVTCVELVPPDIADRPQSVRFTRAAGRRAMHVLIDLAGVLPGRRAQLAALWLESGADAVVVPPATHPCPGVPVRLSRRMDPAAAAVFVSINGMPVPCGHRGEAIDDLGAFRAQVVPAIVEGIRRESGIPLLGLIVRLALRMAAGRLARQNQGDSGMGTSDHLPLRLARLTDGPGPRLDLLHALLFALPGPPLLVFGDEIGMDDALRDSAGCWSPMRWRPEQDGDAVSVESQDTLGSSLLNRVRALARARSGSRALSCGTASPVGLGGGPTVGFLRECRGDVVLVVANLGQAAHTADCDLGGHEGKLVEDIVSGNRFAPVIDARYRVELPPYGWHYLRLITP